MRPWAAWNTGFIREIPLWTLLLNMKYHEVTLTIPDLRLETDGLLFPDTFAIQSYDLSIIVGNALDNAVRACKKLKEEKPVKRKFI